MAEWVALCGMILVIAYCVHLYSDREVLAAYLQRDIPRVVFTPAGGSMILAGTLALIPIAIFVAAMWEARKLFRLLGKAQTLDPATPHILLRLGGLAVTGAAAGIVVRTLIGLVLTGADLPGQRHLVIGIDSHEIASLIIGLLFFAFALMMQEFLRIEEENRSIV